MTAPVATTVASEPTKAALRIGERPGRRVELRGLEPLTPTLPVWCATSCATAPHRAVDTLQGSAVGSRDGRRRDVEAAAVLMAAIPPLLVYLFGGKYFVRGLTQGAVK